MESLKSLEMPPMRRIKNVHFVGIGGAGMCGIAEVLTHQGYVVSGSDLQQSAVTDRLVRLGANVTFEHRASAVEHVDVVVVSSAIGESNPEIVEAHARRIPVVSRAEMLGELMRHRFGIAVAGTHGKTTVTSLIASIFQEAKLDPTFVIGGLLKSENRHAGLGSGRYIIAEADESDASFLFLNPLVAVVTNIDHDHLGTYSQSFENLLDSFKEFVQRLPFYGLVVICSDDMGSQSIIEDLARPLVTYGLAEDADYRADRIVHEGSNCKFRVERPNEQDSLEIEICLPGEQNVRNVLAAIAVASEEGIDDQAIVEGLKSFSGIGRRFEVAEIEVDGHRATLVDDYGHHPTEVQHVLDTVNEIFPGRRVVMVYQPHRYTRTRDLFAEFVDVLIRMDHLILVDTYAASEEPICGAMGIDLIRAIQATRTVPVQFARTSHEVIDEVSRIVADNDVLVVQGAGNVDRVSVELKARAA